MGTKRPKPVLTEQEQARVDALRQARRGRRKGRKGSSVGGSGKKQAAKASYEAQQTRLQQERARHDRERVAVEATTHGHLTRLRSTGPENAPWDDEFIQNLRLLLDRGLHQRALSVAVAVAIATVPWNLPDDALVQRLQQAKTPAATEAHSDRQFMTFVRGPVISAHRRWAKREANAELARHRTSSTAPVSDAELERRRGEATALRRPIAKRY